MKLLKAFRGLLGKDSRPDPFIAQLLAQAEYVIEGANALGDFVNAPASDHVKRVQIAERRADEVRRRLTAELNKTFITPIDREDLFDLSRTVDDILDYIYSTMRELYLFRIIPDERMKAMSNVLQECAQHIHQAITHLQSEPQRATKHARYVLALENKMDALYAEALADMFDAINKPDDIVQMIKLREIYRHVHHAVSSAEQTANRIHDIIIKFY